MIPLWTTATQSVACGCAFVSLARPCVLARLCCPGLECPIQPHAPQHDLHRALRVQEQVEERRGDAQEQLASGERKTKLVKSSDVVIPEAPALAPECARGQVCVIPV